MNPPIWQYRPFVLELPENYAAGSQLLITAYVGETVDGKTDLRITVAHRSASWSSWRPPLEVEEAP